MGQIKGFSKEEKREIFDQAMAFWLMTTQQLSEFFDFCNEMERLARGLLPAELDTAFRNYPDRSKLVPPDIINTLLANRANLRKMFFRRKPYFRPRYAGQMNLIDERIRKAEQVLQSMLDVAGDGSGLPRESDKAFLQALYAGLGCTFVRINTIYDKVLQRDPNTMEILVDENDRPRYEMQKVAQYPESVTADIRRIRFDPTSGDLKNCRLIGYHGVTNLDELIMLNREESSHYQFDEKELRESSFPKNEFFDFVSDESYKVQGKGDKQSYSTPPVERISLRGLFRFGDEANGYRWEDLIVEIGNRKVLLAVKKNDLPIHGWDLFDWPSIDEQPGRIFVQGIVEPARDLFIERFIKRNQSLDNANRNTYVTYIGDASACQNLPQYIESADDQLVKIDLMGSGLTSWQSAIGVLERPPLGQDTFQHSEALAIEIRQTMRQSAYYQGGDPEKQETATGATLLASGTERVHEFTGTKLVDTYFAPTCRKLIKLWNFLHGDTDKTIITVDGRTVQIQKGEIDYPFLIVFDHPISEVTPAQVRRFVEVYPTLVNDPWVNQMVLRETLVHMLDLPNADRLLTTEEYANFDIDRESVALGYGAPQDVHPQDNHAQHIQIHMKYLEYMQSIDPAMAQAQGMSTAPLEKHVAEHQAILDQQQLALGNTKDMGGNVGTANNPENASQRRRQVGAPTGQYTPSESRK